MRAAYLGPPGTNSHDALIASGAAVEATAYSSVPGVLRAVQAGEAELGLVPLENSREGGVGSTLDALVFDAPDLVIVGEILHRVTYVLVAAEHATPDEVRTVHSHPQALGQCATFLAEQLPGAALVAAPSTADAVRAVMEDSPTGPGPHAAIGTRHAAALYGAVVLAEGFEDDVENVTRFGWVARAGTPGPDRGAAGRTALVFWGGGDLSPGWLVDCLAELATRGVNLSRIESRPRRIGLGHYMFFCDLDGPEDDHRVAAAIAALRGHCEQVRILGSFPAAA